MTTLAAFILGALLAATLTLPAFARIVRQRDAAVCRGNLAVADAVTERKRAEKVERFNKRLLDQLDAQIADTDRWREQTTNRQERIRVLHARIVQLEAEALPKAPDWGAAPAEWRAS